MVAVVSPDMQEALVYSVSVARGYALESYIATINVTGTVSGKDFKAIEDITIPLVLSGDGAANLTFVPEEQARFLATALTMTAMAMSMTFMDITSPATRAS